jgi:hypothetical protein
VISVVRSFSLVLLFVFGLPALSDPLFTVTIYQNNKYMPNKLVLVDQR